MSQYIQAISGLRKDKALAAALAVPVAAADGVDVSTWHPGRTTLGYPLAAVEIEADGAGTVDDAALYAYGPYGIGGANKWMFVAYLNNRNQIALTAAVAYVQQVSLPSVFSALAVTGTVAGGVNFGYTMTPIAVGGM